jgi:Xaa-Pro dipeptidase
MFYSDLSPFGVDPERLTIQRLARLRDAMKREAMGALVLTDQHNIRYATNTVFMHGLRATAIQRFVVIPVTGSPLICQRETSRQRKHHRAGRFDAYMFGMRPPVATKDFVTEVIASLRELGVAGEQVGVDSLNLEAADLLRNDGVLLVDGWRALNRARAVKTVDELQLIRWTTLAKERGYDLVRAALHDSNVPEDGLSRIMLDYLLDQGFEAGSEFISIYDSSQDVRPHTEAMGTDLVVVEGDLVICDATVAGPGGYYSDFARTFSRGNPTQQSRARYREAYDTLQEALTLIKSGPCTEFFARFGKSSSSRLPGLDGFHGVGLCIYEAPWLRGGDPDEYAVTLEENMIIALEVNHLPVKLEHLLRVTDSGVEILSTYQLDPELVPA